ncbi:hypothetical protein Hdeb2414_s0012g00382981 [Helianthus debilis subsp. tardiflorus]
MLMPPVLYMSMDTYLQGLFGFCSVNRSSSFFPRGLHTVKHHCHLKI